MDRLVSAYHVGAPGSCVSRSDPANRERGGKRGAGDLLPLTVPEVRRLLLALVEPPERFAFRLAWSTFRRHHGAVAKTCHAARRAGQGAVVLDSPQVQVLQTVNLDLTDEQWMRIAPLLPPQQPVIGRPMLDHRRIVGGMLWIAGTGATWRALPAEFGPWQTVYSRYRRWRREGIWQRIIDTFYQPPNGPS